MTLSNGSWEIETTSGEPLWSGDLKDATYNLETAFPGSLLGLRLIREGVQIDIVEGEDGNVYVEVEAFSDKDVSRGISMENVGLGAAARIKVMQKEFVK